VLPDPSQPIGLGRTGEEGAAVRYLLAARRGVLDLIGDTDPAEHWWLFGQLWVALYRAQSQITLRHHLREEIPS
jgi:hypothetical protein